MWGLIFAIVSLVISVALQIFLTPHTSSIQNAQPSKLSDFDYPTMDEGTAQPIIFGDQWSPNWFVLWYGNFRTTAIKKTTSGGKGK